MGELVDRVDERDRVIGVVDRNEAVAAGWLYRMSMVLCRDEAGRYLVHRRPENSSRFPGEYSWLVAGAVAAGESYAEAAARELHEEMGVRAPVRPLFTFLCRGELSPYWFAVYEATVDQGQIAPQATEVAWHAWLSGAELRDAMTSWKFVSDSRDAYHRYLKLATDNQR
ncbi:NUDIX domain-containing protein [Streptomyces sp. LP05-1]|uniref:NUDIX domain-containing protein n=1 Tax=Streptomyces pyxinae TaxID=2970734 RepID=A0ABT2CC99_9ACTN|nr:NUDIX domain-containing protein [Streptomyces sp. LP05-1]MCS0635001.1 NUDIX domain-containing protein [Streptomyces sp. LP05-1]